MTTRRLAAILAADVVGFSKLIGEDEAGTLETLREIRNGIVNPVLAEHGGRIFKLMGDGMLAEFPSAVQALRAAISMQERMRARNNGLPEGQQVEVRIGVHQGDVVIEGSDLLGDGVNIAARLEALAEPGGICISARVHEDAAGKIVLSAEDMGEQMLKNIARPVRAYRISPPSEHAPPKAVSARPALPLPDRPSLAVLPFQNMSGDPEQEYFADGMVEDIITALSRVRSFFVIARNSSFTYKGKSIDVKQVGRELGVRYVLEGSVRKVGDRVRMTCQLVETETGSHVWANRYDGRLDDIFNLQDEITAQVVTAIEPSVHAAEINRLSKKKTEDLTAYDLYLRALWDLRTTRTKEIFVRSCGLLQTALQHDPNFAVAWAFLGDTIGRAVLAGWVEDTERGIQDACEAARRAVLSDPSDGIILALAAWAFAVLAGRVDQAHELAVRALELQPNSAVVLAQCGWAFVYSGENEKALRCFRVERHLDPMSAVRMQNLSGMAAAHFFSKRFAESERISRQTVEEAPAAMSAWRFLAASLVHLGKIQDAKRAVVQLLEIQPNSSVSRTARTSKFRHEWMIKLYLDALRAAGLPE
jgi:adenylate cyclase